MTYPTRDEMLAMMEAADWRGSQVALDLGISRDEVWDIYWRGEVHPENASFWQMVRREAERFKEERRGPATAA